MSYLLFQYIRKLLEAEDNSENHSSTAMGNAVSSVTSLAGVHGPSMGIAIGVSLGSIMLGSHPILSEQTVKKEGQSSQVSHSRGTNLQQTICTKSICLPQPWLLPKPQRSQQQPSKPSCPDESRRCPSSLKSSSCASSMILLSPYSVNARKNFLKISIHFHTSSSTPKPFSTPSPSHSSIKHYSRQLSSHGGGFKGAH